MKRKIEVHFKYYPPWARRSKFGARKTCVNARRTHACGEIPNRAAQGRASLRENARSTDASNRRRCAAQVRWKSYPNLDRSVRRIGTSDAAVSSVEMATAAGRSAGSRPKTLTTSTIATA